MKLLPRRLLWVGAFASAFFSLEAAPLLKVSAKSEGAFDVELRCSPPDTEGPCAKLEREHRLILLNPDTSQSAEIALFARSLETETEAKAKTAKLLYRFSLTRNLENGKFRAEATVRSPRPGFLDFEMDGASGALEGWIRDPEFKNDLRIQGKLALSPANYFSDEGPPERLPAHEVQGSYRGVAASSAGILNLRLGLDEDGKLQKPPASILGSWVRKRDGAQEFFRTGTYDPGLGLVSLSTVVPEGGVLKWWLAYRASKNGGAFWKGVAISSITGQVGELFFSRE